MYLDRIAIRKWKTFRGHEDTARTWRTCRTKIFVKIPLALKFNMQKMKMKSSFLLLFLVNEIRTRKFDPPVLKSPSYNHPLMDFIPQLPCYYPYGKKLVEKYEKRIVIFNHESRYLLNREIFNKKTIQICFFS